MNNCQSKFLLAGWLMAAATLPASAQDTIIFTKPADLPASKANAFMPSATRRAGDYNAPHALFNDLTPDYPLPRPVFQNNDPSVKEALDKRKNWTLLTPEQILGIQTPEEILGVPDKNNDKKLSLEEQFLARQSRDEMRSATNGHAGSLSLLRDPDTENPDNPFRPKNQDDENSPFRHEPQKLEPGTKYFNQLLNVEDSSAKPDEKQSSAWTSAFAQPSQPKQTDEQLANLERFRALMEPTTPPEKADLPTRFTTSRVPLPAPDPFLQPVPVVNPAGRAVPSLDNIFSRPTGIRPLPGISTPPPAPVATKPTWEPQLPPWLKNGPQPHNASQGF
jgi:hypothetical protein